MRSEIGLGGEMRPLPKRPDGDRIPLPRGAILTDRQHLCKPAIGPVVHRLLMHYPPEGVARIGEVLELDPKSSTFCGTLAGGHPVATILSLKQLRKKRERADKEQRAAENRVRFGRSKKERSRDQWESAKAEKELDGKQLE